MSRNESDLREPRAPEGPEMIAAMRRGVIEALRDHKREGRPIVTWDREAGRIVEVPAGEIIVPNAVEEDKDLASKLNQ